MGEDSGEKTEEPTPHKLREARKKGQITKSKELTSALLMLISFFTIKIFGMRIWGSLTSFEVFVFNLLGEEFSMSLAGLVLTEGFKTMFQVLLPIMLIVFILGVIIEALQTGFLFALESLTPKLDSLNPINGFKKFFSMKQYVELVKSLIKMTIIIIILYFVIKENFFIVLQSQLRNPWLVLLRVGKIVMDTIIRVGVVYFIIALLDYVYQRYEFMKQMRMTKKEIKEEYKRLEGDPIVKQRQREAQRAMAQGRQMGAVPGADVVVTNPVHIAIALQYDQKKTSAPVVVAKGKRMVAEEIKKVAEDYYIPIIENPPLAQALFKQSEVGQTIPGEHYKLVAEILAFVYHLKKKRRAR